VLPFPALVADGDPFKIYVNPVSRPEVERDALEAVIESKACPVQTRSIGLARKCQSIPALTGHVTQPIGAL